MKILIFGLVIWMISIFNIGKAQDSISKPIFKLNQVFTKETDVQSDTKMSFNNQDFVYSIKAHFETSYQISDKIDSLYEVKISLNVINTEVSTNGVKMIFNSQNDSLNTDSIIAMPLSDILGQIFHFKINNAGVIVEADTSSLLKKANNYMSNTLMNGYELDKGDKLDILFAGVDKMQNVGDNWKDTINNVDGQRITDYSVNRIFNQNVSLTQSGSINKLLQIQKGEFKTNALFDGKFTGKIELNRIIGLIASRDLNINMQSSIQIGDNKIPTESQSFIKETIHE